MSSSVPFPKSPRAALRPITNKTARQAIHRTYWAAKGDSKTWNRADKELLVEKIWEEADRWDYEFPSREDVREQLWNVYAYLESALRPQKEWMGASRPWTKDVIMLEAEELGYA